MIARAAVVLATLAAPVWGQEAVAPEAVSPPSGFRVTLHDVLVEEQPYSGETLVVVRVIAPALNSPVLAGQLDADMDWACHEWGIPRAETLSGPPDRIVVEFMAEPVPRGESAPDIRQFFESYSLLDGACIWELF